MHINRNILKTFTVFSFSVLLASAELSAQISDPKEKQKTIDMNYVETFKVGKCDKLALSYYKKMSDKRDGIKPSMSVEITDKGILEKIISLLNKLPDKGDMMIKMGDVSTLEAVLTTGKGENFYFTYYQNSIKTTDTSFYSTPPLEEKMLYELLMSLLKK